VLRGFLTFIAAVSGFLSLTWFAGAAGQGPAVVITYDVLGWSFAVFALVVLFIAYAVVDRH
jgi:hypothetical protein